MLGDFDKLGGENLPGSNVQMDEVRGCLEVKGQEDISIRVLQETHIVKEVCQNQPREQGDLAVGRWQQDRGETTEVADSSVYIRSNTEDPLVNRTVFLASESGLALLVSSGKQILRASENGAGWLIVGGVLRVATLQDMGRIFPSWWRGKPG
jgi:hypothetical protein